MALARPALVALLVGLALLASPALLLQFQEPDECSNAVERLADARTDEPPDATYRYEELSPDAKRAFDRARTAGHSVTVSGERCPEEFDYTADESRYEVVENGTSYVLTTYASDLVPEVPIAAGALAVLGASLLGIGLGSRDEPDARFPAGAGAVGVATLAMVTAAVVLDRALWPAVGWTVLVTAATLLGAGVALRPRRALALGGALAVLTAAVTLPLGGVSVVFLLPAALPVLLVGAGIGGRAFVGAVRQ